MTGTESSHDAPVPMQPFTPQQELNAHDAAVEETRNTVTAETSAEMADPVIPVTLAPVQAAPVKEYDISMKEIVQMVGAMVFVFGFAALGLHAISYVGY
ncbi:MULTISPECIES: hypothetical protein [Acetobacter]|nr:MULTISPECIES: hypothetical protein [Acetobacter]